MSNDHPVRFFFGANSPDGFTGFHKTDLYDPRDGWIAFLIKSGAGTGKATFMRRVQAALQARGHTCETVLCSSDPSSVDAVVAPAIKLCVIDATAPHILEPVAYGECEQLIPFGCCLDPVAATAQAPAWFDAADACAAAHARCCRFLHAAHSLLETSRRLIAPGVHAEKLIAAVRRTVKRECPPNGDRRGHCVRRLLSAVTPQGHLFLSDTVTALCPRIYVLEDDIGVVSAMYMRRIADEAVAAGHDVIACPCPLSPHAAPEHVLVPSLGVGFLTSNHFHRIDFPVYRRTHAIRFTDSELIAAHKQQLRFHRRAATALLQDAAEASAEAKAHHDRMESLHQAVMDWARYETIAAESERTILRIAAMRSS